MPDNISSSDFGFGIKAPLASDPPEVWRAMQEKIDALPAVPQRPANYYEEIWGEMEEN